MSTFEYKIIPAPSRGVKAKGVKGTPARFAHGLEILMNEVAAAGWQYLRADTLPCDERQGLRGWVAVDQHVLVFRRAIQCEAKPALVRDPAVAPTEATDAEPLKTDAAHRADGAPAVRLGPAIRQPKAEAASDLD